MTTWQDVSAEQFTPWQSTVPPQFTPWQSAPPPYPIWPPNVPAEQQKPSRNWYGLVVSASVIGGLLALKVHK